MSHYIDGKTGQYLQINGQPIETHNVEMMMTANWLAISLSRDKNNYYFWEKCVLFNPITRTLYHDNISGWYFHVYGGNYQLNVYYPNEDKGLYALPTIEEAAKQQEQEKESVRNGFNDMINRMDR